MDQTKRLFIIDELTDGKLAKRLSELSVSGNFISIEAQGSNLSRKLASLTKLKDRLFSLDEGDSLVVFVNGKQISNINRWINHHREDAKSKGEHLFFFISGFVSDILFPGEKPLHSRGFRQTTAFTSADPKNAALKISEAFGLSKSVADWDTYFMSLAYLESMLSTDDCTAYGAVIADSENRIISTGHNTAFENSEFRDHEGQCAICQAAKRAFSLKIFGPWRIYTQAVPKNECCLRLFEQDHNSGRQRIKEIIVDRRWGSQRPLDDEQFAREQASYLEAGIKLRWWDGKLLKICGRKRYRSFRSS